MNKFIIRHRYALKEKFFNYNPMGLYLNTQILPHGVIPEHNKVQNSHITPWGSSKNSLTTPWAYNRGFTVLILLLLGIGFLLFGIPII